MLLQWQFRHLDSAFTEGSILNCVKLNVWGKIVGTTTATDLCNKFNILTVIKLKEFQRYGNIFTIIRIGHNRPNVKLLQGHFGSFCERIIRRTRISFEKSTEMKELVLLNSFSPNNFGEHEIIFMK